VLATLVLIAVGLLLFAAYRGLTQVVEQYTATAPQELPRVEIPAIQRQSIKQRVTAFRNAVDAGKATEPLALSAADLNALADDDPNWKGKIYLAIDDDKVKGKVSIPLEKLTAGLGRVGLDLLRGRYLNGEVELKPSVTNDALRIAFQSIEVNGASLPEEVMVEVRKQNLVDDENNDPKLAGFFQKLESITVKNGKVIITPRASLSPPASSTELPGDVLAPANDGQPRPEPSKLGTERPSAEAEPLSSSDSTRKP
jgi:hypothetical protein